MSRVRMPAGNRFSTSRTLETNDMWSKTIGHDPYANSATSNENSSIDDQQAQGILLLARLKNVKNGNQTRGGCGRCGLLGHLTFQCRNEPLAKEAESLGSSDSSSDSGSSTDNDDKDIRNKRKRVEDITEVAASNKGDHYDKKRKKSHKHKKEKKEKKEKKSKSSSHKHHKKSKD